MNDEDQPTAEELAEAETLARALEGGGSPADGAPPEAALAAAALLRHARAADAPPDMVDARVRAAASRALAPPAARARLARWRWLVPIGFVPAAAALALFVLTTRSGERAQLAQAPLPRPEAALLETQARVARGRGDLALLDRQMRAYREALYHALAAREGEGR